MTIHEKRVPHSYLLDNDAEQAGTRFDELSRIYDGNTIRHIEQRGITRGWSCLEVGAGGGSIAAWLSERVGNTGHVLATDINPRCLHALSFSNLEVRQHDIRCDPLPKRMFDLVHARLVLMHLPERESVLERMIAALKPGGWIVLEEFDTLSVLPDPVVSPGEVSLKASQALRQVLSAGGVDLRYGRLLPQKMRSSGLVNIGAEGSLSMWGGCSAGTRLLKSNYEQLKTAILSTGLLSEREFAESLAQLDSEDFLVPSSIMWTAWGRRSVSAKTPRFTSFSESQSAL
jgi:2-polyprenyl-3-methyl-5-hydroxy-6-metoxy-1,4-benzoquinol methylase